jgi:hypothetical protein
MAALNNGSIGRWRLPLNAKKSLTESRDCLERVDDQFHRVCVCNIDFEN